MAQRESRLEKQTRCGDVGVTSASSGIGSSYHGLLGKLLDLLDGLGGALLEGGTM